MAVPRLSDDEVLSVFSFLDVATLVGPVRAVCRRWRDLAFHRDVWKHRRFNFTDVLDDDLHSDVMVRVLEQAPCLRVLDGYSCTYEEFKHVYPLLYRTPCAAEELSVVLFSSPDFEVAKTLSNQIARGRLRRLSIDSFCTSAEDSPACEEFCAILGGAHLEELSFDFTPVEEDERCELVSEEVGGEAWTSGSLKRLAYLGNPEDPFLKFLLGVRAATLETVTLQRWTEHGISIPNLALLGECSNLREVTLPAVVEAASLQRCPKLTSVCLDVTCDTSLTGTLMVTLIDSLVPFFKQATGLTRVDLNVESKCGKASFLLLYILCHFAACARAVEQLSIGCLLEVPCSDMFSSAFGITTAPTGEPFVAQGDDLSPLEFFAIFLDGSRMSSLRELTLCNMPPAGFFDVLRTVGFSELVRLNVSGARQTCVCISSDRLDALSRCVRWMPRFHIKVQCYADSCCDTGLTISCYPRSYGVFGHTATAPCRSHDSGVEWVHADKLVKGRRRSSLVSWSSDFIRSAVSR